LEKLESVHRSKECKISKVFFNTGAPKSSIAQMLDLQVVFFVTLAGFGTLQEWFNSSYRSEISRTRYPCHWSKSFA